MLVGVVGRVVVDSPLWLDEALSVNIAGGSFGDVATALRSEGHPPLYYWLLHGWMSVFGDGDAAVRSLSVVLGLAALPLAWVVGRRAGGRTDGTVVAAWSVVLVALSPYAVRYASEARMYALLVLLVLAGAVLVPDALRSPTALRLAGVAGLTGALIWTHYWSLYLLAVVGGAVVWRWWSARSSAGGGPALRVALAMVAGGMTFLPWVGRFVDQVADTGTPWSGPARPAQVVMDTITDLGTGGVDTFSEGTLLGVVVALLAVLGVLAGRGDGSGDVRLTAATEPGVRPLAVVAFGTLAVGTVVGQLTRSAFTSRYAAVVVPLLLVLAAVGLARLPRRWPAVGGALAVVVLGVVGVVKVDVTDRTEAGALADAIAASAAAGDVVLACPDQLGVSLERALGSTAAGADLPVLPYPAIDTDPRFIEWRGYEDRNDAADPGVIAAEVSNRTTGAVWVVWNGTYRTFEGDCDVLVASLGVLRGGPEPFGAVGDERAFEHGDLLRFPPLGAVVP